MIETKILGDAVGIQRQDVIDKSETTVLPSLNNGVIAGHFKRGRMDKPFKVTSANYRSLLGHDPSNASYLAVEDCFKQGVSEISVLRVGQVGGAGAGGGDNEPIDYPQPDVGQQNYSVTINNNIGNSNNYESKFKVEVKEPSGLTSLYNQDKSQNISDISMDLLSVYMDSSGYINVNAAVADTLLLVRLIPSTEQRKWSTEFINGDGVIAESDGTFIFYLFNAA